MDVLRSIKLNLQAEFFRGAKEGVRQAESFLRKKAIELWSGRDDDKAGFARDLADGLKPLAQRTEQLYREKRKVAEAAEAAGGET